MKPQNDHKVVDSFVQWFEYQLLNEAEAYINVSTPLFDAENPQFSGMSEYSAPFYQWVHDQSITGANIPTASGLGVNYIDYKNGRVFGSKPSGSINYAIKEFNVYMTTSPMHRLLFEDRYQLRPSPIEFPMSGLAPNNVVAPCIFIRPENQGVSPLALGGSITRKFFFNALIYSNDEFKLHAVVSIFMSKLFSYIPVLDTTPLNFFGDYKTGGYNYEHELEANSGSNALLRIASINYFPIENDSISKIHPDFYLGRIFFELHQDLK